MPLCVFVLAATSIQAPKAPPLRPAKNVIAGRATDAGGRPLPGATVILYGVTNDGANTRFEATTNAAGVSRQRVPAGIYGASAYCEKTYRGENDKFTLRPNDGTTAAKYDGASAQIGMRENGFDSFHYPAGSTVEILFTPDGPLIDGTVGNPQTRAFPLPEEMSASSRYLYAMDLPVGAYVAKAAFVRPDGSRVPLMLKESGDFNGSFRESLSLPFRPTRFGDLRKARITLDMPQTS